MFLIIGVVAVFKKGDSKKKEPQITKIEEVVPDVVSVEEVREPDPVEKLTIQPIVDEVEDVNRIHLLFTKGQSKLPIVETLSYRSRVAWQKGKPAWIADYANHFSTSRHFIARSLNGKRDYISQKVSTGDRFNVFRKDKEVNFHLVIDISRCKMKFYYHDVGTDERVLLKTYRVGLGRFDNFSLSGLLTPKGKYKLGEKVAIYRPGTMGLFRDQQIEMIQVFGTRWIPFEEEISDCTEDARGYGIHGVPWLVSDEEEYTEDRECIGKYDSDGCVRLLKEDMEELFSIVITQPTYLEIVSDFQEAELAGIESAAYPE